LIETSTNGFEWVEVDDQNGFLVGTYSLDQVPVGEATLPYTGEVDLVAGGTDVEAAYVRLTVLNKFEGDGAGLAEVRFYSVPSDDPIPGDANGDGKVDEIDAARLATNWGGGSEAEPATWQEGNFNGDWLVDVLDAAILAANWGRTGPLEAEGTAVPEPSVIALLLVGLVFTLAARRRQT
jgi:hypothetical protein